MKYRIQKNYYAVTCKCGHTHSRKTYIPIVFPVMAYDGREAALIGRYIPRTKHDHKDCILNVKKVTREEYLDIKERNSRDPYLQCESIQEQSQYDLSDRFVIEKSALEEDFEKEEPKIIRFNGKCMIKNPKKYIRFNDSL